MLLPLLEGVWRVSTLIGQCENPGGDPMGLYVGLQFSIHETISVTYSRSIRLWTLNSLLISYSWLLLLPSSRRALSLLS